MLDLDGVKKMQNIWMTVILLASLVGSGAAMGYGAMMYGDDMHHGMHGMHNEDCDNHEECEYEHEDCEEQYNEECVEEHEDCPYHGDHQGHGC